MGIARNRTGLCSVLTATLLLVGFMQYAKADPDSIAPTAPQPAINASSAFLVPSAAPSQPTKVPRASVRNLEADGTVSGSEPNPEAFDRQGLETWWRHHQETLKKAE